MKDKRIRLLIICALLIGGYFLAGLSYPGLILDFIAIYAIAATGLDVLFGYSGQISFGHAGFFAIGAYTSGILSVKCGVPAILGLIAGVVVSTLFGILISIPASKLVKHFLSLFTIAFGQMVYMFVNSTVELTGGPVGLDKIPKINIFGWQADTNQKFYIIAAICLIVTLVLKNAIIKSRIGRGLIAVRENIHAAQGLGIKVRTYKVMAFAISAASTGLAGALYAHLVGFISPTTFNSAQSTLFMTMLLFGGIGTLAGPVIGSAALIFVKEVFRTLANYQVLIYGVFILLVLFFFPNGIVGIANNIKNAVLKLINKRKGGQEDAEA